MLLHLTEFSSKPLQTQIVEQMVVRILDGDQHNGKALCSYRELARIHKINASTVKKAYESLIQKGLLQEDNGTYFISEIDETLQAALSSEFIQQEKEKESGLENESRLAREI